MCVQGPSPPCHETSHNLREKDLRDYRQDRRHPRYRDADRSHVSIHHTACTSSLGKVGLLNKKWKEILMVTDRKHIVISWAVVEVVIVTIFMTYLIVALLASLTDFWKSIHHQLFILWLGLKSEWHCHNKQTWKHFPLCCVCLCDICLFIFPKV